MSHQRMRERIVWSPVWGKQYEGWAANFIRKNIWRCDNINSFQDLMQDAYLVFARVAMTYPRVVEPKNFMALFKMAMANKMHDRSLYKKRKSAAEVCLSSDVSEFFTGRIGEMTNAGYLGALLNEAPEELRLALNLLAEGVPRENFNVAKKSPGKRTLHTKENLSMVLARILGLGPDADPLTDLKKLLTQ